MWLERLEAEPLLAIPWLEHPHRDAYWKHGSVNEDIGAIQAAVLAVGGWNDAYTNAVPRLVSTLKSPAKGIIGPWAHKYPHFAVPEPRIGFLQEALRWWDRWLKGIDTGVDKDPAFRTYIMDPRRPGASVTHITGRWVATTSGRPTARAAPPAPERRRPVGHPGQRPAGARWRRRRRWAPTAASSASSGSGPEFPGDQRRDDAGSLTFDSAPLTKDIDLVGAAVLQLKVSADKPVAHVAVRLNQVWPDGAVSRLSYAVFNLCHRDGHEHPQPLEPGKAYTVRIPLDDVACKVPKGHQLRVSISTTYWPMIWPTPEPVTLTVHTGASFIDVPVRKPRRGERAPTFAPAEAAPPVKLVHLDKPSNRREVTIDQRTGDTKPDHRRRLRPLGDCRTRHDHLGLWPRALQHPPRRPAVGPRGMPLDRGARPRRLEGAHRNLVGHDRQQDPFPCDRETGGLRG
jgi:putative CocE/NonD family hydrolase